jgi:hypothetical protein
MAARYVSQSSQDEISLDNCEKQTAGYLRKRSRPSSIIYMTTNRLSRLAAWSARLGHTQLVFFSLKP